MKKMLADSFGKLKRPLFFLLSFSLFFTSCSIEKRVYSNGYSFEMRGFKPNHNDIIPVSTISFQEDKIKYEKEINSYNADDNSIAFSDETLSASIDNSIPAVNREERQFHKSAPQIKVLLEKAKEINIEKETKTLVKPAKATIDKNLVFKIFLVVFLASVLIVLAAKGKL